MAEIRVSTKKVIALILDKKEARWLKGIMQNPLSDGYDPEKESEEDRDMRHEIFNGLEDAGI